MPAHRFYIDADLNGTLSLQGAELHHLAHVMRVEVGEEVELVNGRGAIAIAEVESISKQAAILKVISANKTPMPSSQFILAVPFMRPQKLELIIEKCTELGASAFWLYPALHSDKDDLSPHQLERLQHIAISAMKQCGRLDLPQMKVLAHFEELFECDLPVFFGDTRKKAATLIKQENFVFISGPEKGFSEKEVKILEQKATPISLHKNTLRAETAPIAALLLLSNFV